MPDSPKPIVATVSSVFRDSGGDQYLDVGWVQYRGQKRLVHRHVAGRAATWCGATDGPWVQSETITPLVKKPRALRASAREAAWWDSLVLVTFQRRPPQRDWRHPAQPPRAQWFTATGLARALEDDRYEVLRRLEDQGPAPSPSAHAILEAAGYSARGVRRLAGKIQPALNRLTRAGVLVTALGLGLRGREAREWALREWAGD